MDAARTRPLMIGLLLWEEECAADQLEGTVFNPKTFSFPVRRKKVKGTGLETIVKNPTAATRAVLIEAAQELEKEGVKAITTDCGFNAIWQKELADSVSVPVFASGLLLVPLVHRMLGRGKKVGIITADKLSLTEKHLKAVGIDESIPICIIGMEKEDQFSSMLEIPKKKVSLDIEKFESEVTKVARRLVEGNADVGAIVLECTDLSPFAGAIQRATGLPVFDIVALTEMLHTATSREVAKQAA